MTINGITKIFTATSGTLQFCACSTDAIYINTNNVQIGLSVQDTSLLFKSHSNVNDPLLLLDFTNVSLTNGSFGTSGSGAGSQHQLWCQSEHAERVYSAGAVARVPEPSSLSLFAGIMMSLLMFRALRRRAISYTR